MVKVEDPYQWLYVYGFVRPTTGQSFWLLMPTVSIIAFNLALQQFCQATHGRPINLLMDRAGWHVSPKVTFPDHIRPLFQPAYSPEVQPAEHLWSLVDAPLVNQHFVSLQHLEDTLIDRCCWLQDHPDIIRSTTNFHWWPQAG
jgi:transposase